MKELIYLDISFSYTLSIDDYKSNTIPFFFKYEDENEDENEDEHEHKNHLDYNTFFKDININDEIKNFFILIGSKEKEIYINNWTILSHDNIIDIYNNHKAENINVIDIALLYLGMGHVQIIFYDPIQNLLFSRHDGGSNGWDREDCFNKLKQYQNKKIYNKNGFSFQDFLHKINNNEEIEMIF